MSGAGPALIPERWPRRLGALIYITMRMLRLALPRITCGTTFAKYNLVPCPDPLHRYHKVPVILSVSIDIDYLYRAAKYVRKAFDLFDEKTSVKVNTPSAFEALAQNIERLDEMLESAANTTDELRCTAP